MKTTVEIPDSVFRKVKSFASGRGLSLKRFITEALEEKMRRQAKGATGEHPPWMKLAGTLSHQRRALQRIEQTIEDACERIDPEGWE